MPGDENGESTGHDSTITSIRGGVAVCEDVPVSKETLRSSMTT